MKAGVWRELGVLRCEERERPAVGPGRVLVEVAYCGFCGSDVHFVEGRYPIGPPPQVLGHEVAGVVVEAGPGVDPDLLGARVACDPVASCGACAFCRVGRPTHCTHQVFHASGFAELALFEERQVFRVPDRLELIDAAFLEPTATALRAVETAGLRAGETVLVIGGGALGQLVASVARVLGAGAVVVSEPRRSGREMALRRGADLAVDPSAEDLGEVAKEISPRRGFDLVFEVAGVPAALEGAPSLCCRGGRVLFLGVVMPAAEIAIRPGRLNQREVSMTTVFGGGDAFPRAVPLLSRIDPSGLLSAVAELERIEDVYAEIKAGEHLKVTVRP